MSVPYSQPYLARNTVSEPSNGLLPRDLQLSNITTTVAPSVQQLKQPKCDALK